MRDAIDLFHAFARFERNAKKVLGSRFIGLTKEYIFDLLDERRASQGFNEWTQDRFARALAFLQEDGVIAENRGGISITAEFQYVYKLREEDLRWARFRRLLSTEDLERIKIFLKKKKIKFHMVLSIEKEGDTTYYLATSQGTFHSDDLQNWKEVSHTVGYKPGNNATGHWLPDLEYLEG